MYFHSFEQRNAADVTLQQLEASVRAPKVPLRRSEAAFLCDDNYTLSGVIRMN